MTFKNRFQSSQTQVYWLFNSFSFIQILLFILRDIGDPLIIHNNWFFHFIYNVTSTFIIIPIYIIGMITTLGNFLAEGSIYEFYQAFPGKIILVAFLLSFFTNLIIAKLLFTPFFQNIYEKYLKPHSLTTTFLVVIILILFAVN